MVNKNIVFAKEIRNWHAKDAKQITFIVTQRCNLQCRYCYMVGKNDDHTMSFDVAKRAIDYCLDNREQLLNNDYIILDFIGGEPLIEIDLIDQIVDYFKLETYRRNSPWFGRYRISISTNGLLYSSAKVQRFLAKNKEHVSIGISIDGTKEKHDLQRVYPDGRGSYDDVIKNVALWIKQYPESSTKVTIGHDDLPYIKESIIHLWNLGIKSIPANPIFEDVWEKDDDKIYESQLIELADYIIDNNIWGEYTTTLFSESTGFKQTEDEINKNFCGTGHSLAIDSEGKLYPCVRYAEYSLRNKPAYILGDIYNGVNYDKLRPFKILTAKVQSQAKCIECPVSVGCAYCQAQNYDSSKNDTNFERATFSCDMHKARVRANNYFWAKMYNKYNFERKKEFSIYGSCERKMYFMLDESCAKICANYTAINQNKRLETEKLLVGLEFAKNNFCQPVFLHSNITFFQKYINDSVIAEKLAEHIIKHIIPYSKENLQLLKYVKPADIIVTFDKTNVDEASECELKNCILLVDNKNLNQMYDWIKKLFIYYNRINLKCDLQTFSDLTLYEKELRKVMQIIINYAQNGKIVELDVLTDRLYIDYMDNCFAGEKNVTLSPDGKIICCPAFYYSQSSGNSIYITDFDSQYNMTKLDKSPICKECDAYQCERCVYLNKVRTSEYNIPSELQCLKAHKERELTRMLRRELLKIESSLNLKEIKPIEYEDPCKKVVKMWNLI